MSTGPPGGMRDADGAHRTELPEITAPHSVPLTTHRAQWKGSGVSCKPGGLLNPLLLHCSSEHPYKPSNPCKPTQGSGPPALSTPPGNTLLAACKPRIVPAV